MRKESLWRIRNKNVLWSFIICKFLLSLNSKGCNRLDTKRKMINNKKKAKDQSATDSCPACQILLCVKDKALMYLLTDGQQWIDGDSTSSRYQQNQLLPQALSGFGATSSKSKRESSDSNREKQQQFSSGDRRARIQHTAPISSLSYWWAIPPF